MALAALGTTQLNVGRWADNNARLSITGYSPDRFVMMARPKLPPRTTVAEDVIRDRLAERLELIEEGLVLAKVEHHLPSTIGAAGFVDIVARDALDNLVLIEIKRSTAASRQAIQELLKYVALFVENHRLRRRQVRCLVVSTSWHELAAPFSEMAASEAFQFEGFILEVAADGSPLKVTRFEPSATEELKLAEPYMLVCYESAEHRDAVGALKHPLIFQAGIPNEIGGFARGTRAA